MWYLFVSSNRLCTVYVYERMYLGRICLYHITCYVYEHMYLGGICLYHLTGYVRCMFLNVCI